MSTYSELISQISELKKQAEKQRKEEFSTVIRTIKRQISEYGISAEDLGFSAQGAGNKKTKAQRTIKRRGTSTRSKVAPKYRDQFGNTWTGRGKTPKWVTAALSSGVTLEALKIV